MGRLAAARVLMVLFMAEHNSMSIGGNGLSVPEHELARFRYTVADVRDWLDLKTKTGRCSFGFVLELALHRINRGYNVHTILDEIGRLEGTVTRPSLTKSAGPFTGDVLRGLWHKHHHQTYFLAKNLILEMQRPDTIRNVIAPYLGRCVHEVAGEIAYATTIGAYQQRAQLSCNKQREQYSRITGQWIVFEKVNGANYYLTLGCHGEDKKIKAKVDAYRQFDSDLVL